MTIIREFEKGDISECFSIYKYYIENTCITFEETPPTIKEFEARVEKIANRFPFLVAVTDNTVVGFAYLDTFNERSAYRFTADLSIYLDKNYCHKNIGSRLYLELEKRAKLSGIKNIISLITAQNENSLRFHEKMGFQCVGELNNVGFKFDQWLSVKYYQKQLFN